MAKKYDVASEFQPISAWGYFGYNIVFSIPVVGFILLLVFALGGTSNINLKNYARSFFCVYLLILIIAIILIATGVTGFIFSGLGN